MDNKYTLITGGTEGIGLEIAKLFAKDKHNLFIVARNRDKLEAARNFLEREYKIIVFILDIDLTVDNSCEKIYEFVDKNNLIVDNLINNAGIGSFGLFNEEKEGFEEKIIKINIISLTKLTKHFIKDMIRRGEGGILNVASTAAFVSGPKMAMYYSTKAYVLSLTESLHEEVKALGVRISCLCPGPVKTSFQEKAGVKKSEKMKKLMMSPEDVAKAAYKGFKHGKCIVIPGSKNKILVLGNKILPRALGRKLVAMSNKG
ncbi:SDR family NAD(P)-dependent oxidoreductase [Clostridium vincentii]|uniref:3-oxoacyl-[acyl-carrier-protein] reductase FabG n=1 Tax=Clostridium vincentii TaxID=52704 RepID=A0A2T0BH68_9CLOT|nr:SDR family oxidoreductase [Clostridium vincentii]PRR83250.1 3-oxoacyl-[acyl-carrier-protein] reductase FabG [Clostridium vincentii]